ncbi:MAG: glycosyltransferase [Bacteroidota bacterium]
MIPLSVVIITFNEEKNIGRCLDSVKDVADDIVVLDSFSSDRTKEICCRYGVNFIQRKWEGYSTTKNFANSQTKYDLILSIDADESLSDELKKSILNVKRKSEIKEYKFNRMTNYCGKWIKHGGWYPDVKVRIFDRRKFKWEGMIHEKLSGINEKFIELLNGDCLHYSYYSVDEHYKQVGSFTDIASKALFVEGKKPSFINLFISPVAKFIRDYFFRLGLLDGYYGFLISKISASATFLKYYKLKHLWEKKMKSVGIEMEKLSNLNSGLGQFCLHLGQSMVVENTKQIEPLFYLPIKRNNIFGNNFKYKTVFPIHKITGVRNLSCAVWHCTHQQSNYLPSDKKIKIILTIHDLNFLDKYQNNIRKSLMLHSLQKKIDRSSVIVFVSHYTEKIVKENLDISCKKSTVIYNGNTLMTFPQSNKPDFMHDGEFILSLGIINPKKNLVPLLFLLEHYPLLNLVIAGIKTHPYAQKIVEEAKKMGVEKRLIMPGVVNDEEKYWLYMNCKSFVCPSISEGFGLPIIEAMSVGKPVFLSNCSSLPEIGGKEAYYWNSFEPEHMNEIFENGMHDFTSDSEKTNRLKQWANRFSWSNAAKEYHILYLSL